MSSWYVMVRSSFIVSEKNKDEVARMLEAQGAYCSNADTSEVKAVEVGDGRYILEPMGSPFDGEWCSSGPDEEVREVLELCESGSYASFRNDDYCEYSLWWKDGEGVHEDWQEFVNPFNGQMDAIDEQALGIFRR